MIKIPQIHSFLSYQLRTNMLSQINWKVDYGMYVTRLLILLLLPTFKIFKHLAKKFE